MAQQSSFDIVSNVDLQEVDNALNQAMKEIGQRYDFRDSKTTIELDKKEHKLTIATSDEFHLKSAVDVLQSKLVKRSVPLQALSFGTVTPSSGGSVRQEIKLNIGINKDHARELVKFVKDLKLKVQAQIMDDQVRISGKSKDELQAVITSLREAQFPFAMQFVNYR
jgi:uncharacterized protein YajQ (UPF0234 family)